METYDRECPVCHSIVTHKNKDKWRDGVKHSKPCIKCSRSMIGRANAKTATCPLCSETFEIKLKRSDEHFRTKHQLTTEQALANATLNGKLPVCRCGCGKKPAFKRWDLGWVEFVVGHNAYIHDVCTPQEAQAIVKKRKASGNWKKWCTWGKGKTKENNEIVAARIRKASATRKAKFAAGTLRIWSKGKTKYTCARVWAFSQRQIKRFKDGILVPWAKGKDKSDPRIARMAAKVSFTHSKKALRDRLDAMKRLDVAELKRRIEEPGMLRVINDSLSRYVNDQTPNIEVECIKNGHKATDNLKRLSTGRCWTCDPGGSAEQAKIVAWLQSITSDEVQANRRSILDNGRAELDIFVPAKMLAIEFNGLYWHSIVYKSSQYHDNKTRECAAKGITLFHVFEDEWHQKRPIVQSMIRHKLGLTTTKVSARKCQLKALTTQERRQFFDENHIDGDVNAKVAWGLIHESVIVAAMALRTPFHKNQGTLEVARFCSKIDTNVMGALGKLTQQARTYGLENGFQKLMTYVDTRFGTRNSWDKSGWTHVRTTSPRFWWTDYSQRFNRFKFKADKASNLTEAAVAKEAGVTKIWGCANRVLELPLAPPLPHSAHPQTSSPASDGGHPVRTPRTSLSVTSEKER